MEIVKSMYNHRIIKPSFRPFITVWDTTQAGAADNSIQILTNGAGYDCRVYWGDGTADSYTGTTPTINHTYASAGTYQVEIYGKFPRIYMNNNANYKSKLIEVKQWGDIEWDLSLHYAFFGCNKLELTAQDTPNLTNTTSLFGMFRACGLKGDNTNWNWNTSNVTNMSYMFFQAGNFDGDIGNWNTGNVTNMSYMFVSCIKFDQDIGNWNTEKVTNMYAMFGAFDGGYSGATLFNKDIGGWNVSNVTNMDYLFAGCSNFNQDISNWNTGNVISMYAMFRMATSFNQDLDGWDVSNVTNMGYMFFMATSFNQDLGGWDVSQVTNMFYMFGIATSFNQDISGWDVSSVTNMSYMFRQAYSFNQDISGWDFTSVITLTNFMLDRTGVNSYQTAYYDLLLQNWENNPTLRVRGLNVNMGGAKYTNAGAGGAARTSLINNYSWTITDGGGI